MTRRRRPRVLTALLVFFLWVDAKTIGTLVLPSTSGGYYFFDAIGHRWVHFALGVVTVALALTATGYLWRPVAGWFEASMVALAAYALQIVAVTAWMTRRLPEARAATAESRTARGLPGHEEALEAIITPAALWTTTVILMVILALLAAAARRHRGFPSESGTD